MSLANSPIECVAAAVHAACLRDLPNITYRDRDWVKYRVRMDTLSCEEKAVLYGKKNESSLCELDYVELPRRPSPLDIEVVAMFPQTWGSAALGFGGLGGQDITSAYTVIIESFRTGHYAVYFGPSGKLAYLVSRTLPDGTPANLNRFFDDLTQRSMANCQNANARYQLK